MEVSNATPLPTMGSKRQHDEPPEASAAALVTPDRTQAKKKRNERVESEAQDSAAAEEKEIPSQDDSSATKEESSLMMGDTLMGFGKHRDETFRFVLLNEPGYVRWAQRQKDPSEMLAAFCEWTLTEEAQSLLVLEQGKSLVFTFGQHRGETFEEIAHKDPEYHLRYKIMKQDKCPPLLERYIQWFNEWSKSPSRNTDTTAAARHEPEEHEVFGFGQHQGKTFRQVSKDDPTYHLRYKSVCPGPNLLLDRYIAWFNKHSGWNAKALRRRHKRESAERIMEAAEGYIDWAPNCWF